MGTTPWFNSGDIESGIALGSHTFEFKSVAGWDAPANQAVTINNGQTTSAGGTYTNTPAIPEGLIAHWLMNDNAATKTVADSGGGNYHGTAQQNTAILTTAGKLGTALAFNGTSDWIDCGTNAALLPDAWTLCAWVKCEDMVKPQLISFGGSYPGVKLQQDSGGKPRIFMGASNYREFDGSAWTTLKDGQWHFVVFSIPGKAQTDIQNAKMYLDGVPVASSSVVATGPQQAKTRFLMGNNTTTGTHRFKGAIDDLMLFDRVLTETEINRIKNRIP